MEITPMSSADVRTIPWIMSSLAFGVCLALLAAMKDRFLCLARPIIFSKPSHQVEECTAPHYQ
ncbi:hypothetical protein [Sinorhizobium fredii]|uniref:hypothetical protein n=1 Tax=Rhizobium fredii TaxID=380 RepID=UPI0004AF42D3|nr:hypothetical protein [Sinorhizobium fredii]